MEELDNYLNQVKYLPPAPTLLPQLLTLLSDPETETCRIVDLIAYEPALTVGVLQLCNSAIFGGAQPAQDLREAVTRLGFRPVYQLVAAILGARALGGAQVGYGIQSGELWKHSVTAAICAKLMAKRLGDNEDAVFTSALLHDIGKNVLTDAIAPRYEKLLEQTAQGQQSLLEAEKSLLGVQHAEIGGRLLARWKFSAPMVAAVWFHHAPASAGPHSRQAAYVYLADMIAHFIGRGFGYNPFALRGRGEALQILNLTPEHLPHFMIATLDQLASIEMLFAAGRT